MLIEFEGKSPQISENVFLAPTAVLIGNVRVQEGASIWFGTVLRADHGTIIIGPGSSVQDNATMHVPEDSFTILGENVTVGHGAILEGCRIGSKSVIGINAVVLPGAEIGEEVMVAAGTVITEGKIIPPRTLVAGVPGKVIKELSGSSLNWIGRAASAYHNLRSRYLEEGIDRHKAPGDLRFRMK